MSEDRPEPISEELASLLEAERDRPDAPTEARERVFVRVAAALGLPDGGGQLGGDGGGTATPAPSGGAIGASSMAHVLSKPAAIAATAFVLGAATGIGAYATIDSIPKREASTPQETAALTETSAMPSSPPPLPPPVASSAVTAEASSSRPLGATPRKSAPSLSRAVNAGKDGGGRDLRLAQERALLEVARTAIARGKPKSAIRQLQRHASQFPSGQLGQEREAMMIQAQMMAGRPEEAAEGLERFRKEHPDSVLLPAIESTIDAGR